MMLLGVHNLSTTQPDRFRELAERFHLNEYAAPPQIGDVFMIKGLVAADASAPNGLNFHFAGVVARSGTDYVTMENYARHIQGEDPDLLSSGDPRWFFQMYGTAQAGQSFHSRTWTRHPAMPDRVVLSIRLSG
jgi:hypothetical protein